MDFGLTASKDLDEVLSKKVYGTERRGTLPYLAPEARARDLPRTSRAASSRARAQHSPCARVDLPPVSEEPTDATGLSGCLGTTCAHTLTTPSPSTVAVVPT